MSSRSFFFLNSMCHWGVGRLQTPWSVMSRHGMTTSAFVEVTESWKVSSQRKASWKNNQWNQRFRQTEPSLLPGFFSKPAATGVAMFFSYLTRNRWPHLLGLAANLGKLGEAGCFFQAEKTQWYKFYNYGVFCFFGGVGSCETTSWPFQNRWHQLLLGSSLKSRRMKCFGLGRSYPENPKSRGGFEKCEKCSPLILGGWFSSLQKVHIKIGSTPCVSWEILILPADRAIEHEVDEDPVLKLVKIFLHSFIYIYTYIYHISYLYIHTFFALTYIIHL